MKSWLPPPGTSWARIAPRAGPSALGSTSSSIAQPAPVVSSSRSTTRRPAALATAGRTRRSRATEAPGRQASQKSTLGTVAESTTRGGAAPGWDTISCGGRVIEPRLLTPEQERLRGELRQTLRELGQAVVAVGAADEDRT